MKTLITGIAALCVASWIAAPVFAQPRRGHGQGQRMTRGHGQGRMQSQHMMRRGYGQGRMQGQGQRMMRCYGQRGMHGQGQQMRRGYGQGRMYGQGQRMMRGQGQRTGQGQRAMQGQGQGQRAMHGHGSQQGRVGSRGPSAQRPVLSYQQLLKSCDKNHDGRLDENERQVFRAEMEKRRKAQAEKSKAYRERIRKSLGRNNS